MPRKLKKSDYIERYLNEGYPVREVAKADGVRCSVRWVNAVAAARSLPKNVQIVPSGVTEQAILRALVATNMNIPFVARLFSQAPPNIKRLIFQLRHREKKKHGDLPLRASAKA